MYCNSIVKYLCHIIKMVTGYCRTHNLRVCLYIAYIASGSPSLYIKTVTLYFFLNVLALSAAATIANIKIRYDAKTTQFAIFGTRVICVFYSIHFEVCAIVYLPTCINCTGKEFLIVL